MWRLRIMHATGYAYKTPVTASYNEARLTPRSDGRQNVILNRVETVPATRSYRYVDYWGTAVTTFDLHAPHTELEVTGLSVVETDVAEKPEEVVDWDEVHTTAVIDRFDEYLSPTAYVPQSKKVQSVGKRIAKDVSPRRPSSPRRNGCTRSWTTCRAPRACTPRRWMRCEKARGSVRTTRI